MTHLTVHEWGRVEVGEKGFTRNDADALLAAARAHSLGGADGTDILCDHHRYLRARQMVGVIAGRSCSLEILPKVDPEGLDEKAATVRGRLVHMLGVALGLELSTGAATAMAHGAESLLEVFIRAFADGLLEQVRRGLPRQYRVHEDDLRALRGRLNVVRQFTAHAVRPDRLACRFDELDGDIPLMQVMKACVLLLGRHSRSADTQRKLAELRFFLAEVSEVPRSMLPCGKVQVDRASHRWRSLLELAKMLLGSSWQKTNADALAPEGITLLFPMNDLFERYVAVELRRALADTELEVVAQGGFAYCLGPWREGEDCLVGNSHPTRPDILVKRDGRVVAVVDTKWKQLAKGVSHSDVYQMMAYARLYDCHHLILLYPSVPGETEVDVEAHGIPRGSDRLDVATVSLDQDPKNVQHQLGLLIRISREAA